MRMTFMTLLLVLAVTGVLTAAPALTPQTAATIRSLSSLQGQAFDVAFLRALIPVHEEAVEVAMMATLNADHTELLKWNQRVVERKNEQVRSMLAWLKEMGAGPFRRNVGVQTAAVKKMRSMKDAALEKAYLPLMASHLEQSAALAALAIKKASRAEIRAFAQGIVKVETQEAAMLRGWMRKWYTQ